MTSNELRTKYLKFFESRGHTIIPSAPLVPENDPTVLFTTAGMQPLVPYLLGQPHPAGKRLTDTQKCLRTDDIDEVGDSIHHTFFEMLGNWSLGDYFKKEAINFSYEFLKDILKIDMTKLYITCFAGDQDAPKDVESAQIWESVGIPPERISFHGKKDNWWGPAGETGPCGPDTEMHYDLTGQVCELGPNCRPGCNCGRFTEIWNDVFMQYNKTADGKFELLKQPNVDTGMGLERVLAILNDYTDDYLSDLWQKPLHVLEQLTLKDYGLDTKRFRIILDHLRATVFVISAGIEPSNKQQGYILRRLIRRAVVQLNQLKSDLDPINSCISVSNEFITLMSPVFPELTQNHILITSVLTQEIERFQKTLQRGLREIEKQTEITGKIAFDLLQTYGFPWELTVEIASQKGQQVDMDEFKKEFEHHQELSRTASKGMFKGGLADHSETVTKYHTATHLIHESLRRILGTHVAQMGSNITGERLRFDFTQPQALTDDEIKQVEDMVNEQIANGLTVTRDEMTFDEAKLKGALAFFGERYGARVSVYSIGSFSKEVCGGPHVANTLQIGPITIYKQESIGAGKRRLYAKLRT